MLKLRTANHMAVITMLGATALLALTAGCPQPPTPITVDAGADQTVDVGATGTATAIVSNATGTVTYQWMITSPGGVTGSSTDATVSFTGSAAGAATLTVTASDSGTGTSATDSATITFVSVTPPPALSADAGADQSVAVGSIVQLTGAAVGGTAPYAFQWQQISGPVQTIDPATGAGAVLTVIGAASGTAIFQLTVTDGAAQTATDTVTVTVTSPGATFTFTTGTDNLTGTDGNDTFNAPIEVVTGFGALQTLNPGDRANGGGGNNTLNAVLNGASLVPGALAPIILDIQTFNITDLVGVPLDAIAISGLATFNSVGSPAVSIVQNLSTVINAGIASSATAGLILNFSTAALSGPSDAMTLTLSNAGGAQLIIVTPGTATSSVETVTINSISQPNTLNVLTEGGGTATLTTVNVMGDTNLTINAAIAASVLNAVTFTGNLTMNTPLITITGVNITGGNGNDLLAGSPLNDTISGGPGNDDINGLAGIDGITLGAGADMLELSAAGAAGVDRKVVSDFDDTPATGDVLNVSAGSFTLTGTDDFTGAASLQTHAAAGALGVLAATEIVVVTSGQVPNFTDAGSLDGTNLLAAVGGAVTGPLGANNVLLFAVEDSGGNVGIYLGQSGANATFIAAELTLVAVLQGPNVNIDNLVFNNFSNL